MYLFIETRGGQADIACRIWGCPKSKTLTFFDVESCDQTLTTNHCEDFSGAGRAGLHDLLFFVLQQIGPTLDKK